MSKAVLMSIQPRFCELIANGKKTIEVRKTKPKLQTPFKVYIYETQGTTETPFIDEEGHHIFKGRGQVIGEFVCDFIYELHQCELTPYFYEIPKRDLFLAEGGLSYVEICDYIKNLPYHKPLYGWHITNLVIYDQPKELSEFWLYNEELHKRYESDEDYCAWGNSTTESGCPTNDCEGTDLLQCYQCWEYWSGWCHKLKKAPQSWCYVEELDND